MYENYLNIKYKNRGMCVEDGLDCLTFILYFYKEHLKHDILIDIPDYPKDWYKNKELKDLYSKNLDMFCKNVTHFKGIDYLSAYDILLFSKYEDVNRITHAGVYIGNSKMIHCVENRGVIISDINAIKNKLLLIGEVK